MSENKASEIIIDLTFSDMLSLLRDENNIAYRKNWNGVFIFVNNVFDLGHVFVKYTPEDKSSSVFVPDFKDIFAEDWTVQLYDTDTGKMGLKVPEETIDAVEDNEAVVELSIDGSVEVFEAPQEITTGDIKINSDDSEFTFLDEELNKVVFIPDESSDDEIKDEISDKEEVLDITEEEMDDPSIEPIIASDKEENDHGETSDEEVRRL